MRARTHRTLAGAVALGLGIGGAVVVAAPASAATIPVLNNSDDVTVMNSLPWAIDQANQDAAADTITFDMTLVASPITLGFDLPDIIEELTIEGPGSGDLTIDAPGTVFTILPTARIPVSIRGLTLTSAGASANGIDAELCDLTVSDIVASGFDTAGIIVFDGSLDGTDITADGNGYAGVSIFGFDATETLTLQTVRASGNGVVGVLADLADGVSQVGDLIVNGSPLGVSLTTDGGSLTIDDVHSDGSDFVGIWVTVTGGGAATFTNGSGNGGTGAGIALDAADLDSTIRATGLIAENNEGSGVPSSATDGASVTITGAQALTNLAEGFIFDASDGGEIKLLDSLSQGNGFDPCNCGGSGIDITADDASITIDRTRVIANRALYGGGIEVFSLEFGASLTITNTTITGNRAFLDAPDGGLGGGLHVETFLDAGTTMRITDSVIGPNVADVAGGGLYLNDIGGGLEAGAITILRSTITGNTTPGYGAGIAIDNFGFNPAGALLTIDSSTISNNMATGVGGGLYVYKDDNNDPGLGLVDVVNSTISGNSADHGAAAYIEEDSVDPDMLASSFRNSTITANTAATGVDGMALAGDEQALTLDHTILAANGTSDLDDAGAAFAAFWSLVQHPGSSVLAPADGNKTGLAPGLGPLANNGGPTLTHALLDSSPALNAGNPAFAPPPGLDQRGSARVFLRIDIGSVEMQTLAATGQDPRPGILGALSFALLGLGLVTWATRRRTAA